MFDGQTVLLPDGRRVSLERLLWEARQQQARELGRLCRIVAVRVWRTLVTLFGPPMGWQRHQLPAQASRPKPTLVAVSAAEPAWFDPASIVGDDGDRSDDALGRSAAEKASPTATKAVQQDRGPRSAAA